MQTKKQISVPVQLRQGDVLLVRVSAIPTGMKAAKRDRGRVVLAYGEVTGHAHAIHQPDVHLLELDDKAAMAQAARELLASVGLTTEIRDEEVVGMLDVGEAAELTHEEHGTIPLEEGAKFVVIRQREYAPEAIRQVAD